MTEIKELTLEDIIKIRMDMMRACITSNPCPYCKKYIHYPKLIQAFYSHFPEKKEELQIPCPECGKEITVTRDLIFNEYDVKSE